MIRNLILSSEKFNLRNDSDYVLKGIAAQATGARKIAAEQILASRSK